MTTKKALTKTTIGYVKDRVTEIVRCTNGELSSRFNSLRKKERMTLTEMTAQIKSGVAELKSDDFLKDYESPYGHQDTDDILPAIFNFDFNAALREAREHNKRIKSSLDEAHLAVERRGKRLVDAVVLGIIEQADLPRHLEELSSQALYDFSPKA